VTAPENRQKNNKRGGGITTFRGGRCFSKCKGPGYALGNAKKNSAVKPPTSGIKLKKEAQPEGKWFQAIRKNRVFTTRNGIARGKKKRQGSTEFQRRGKNDYNRLLQLGGGTPTRNGKEHDNEIGEGVPSKDSP